MDFPGPPLPPLFLSTSTGRSGLDLRHAILPSSFAWPTANKTFYAPFNVPWYYPVKRVWWQNGATVSGNVALALYTFGGARIYTTGSTAQAGTSVPQYVTPTAFLLAPGVYYLALGMDNTTGTMLENSTSATALRGFGVLEETTFPPPATMTPVTIAINYLPYCGITLTASGF